MAAEPRNLPLPSPEERRDPVAAAAASLPARSSAAAPPGSGRSASSGGSPSRFRRTFSVVVRGKSPSGHQDARATRWWGASRAFAAATIGPTATAAPLGTR